MTRLLAIVLSLATSSVQALTVPTLPALRTASPLVRAAAYMQDKGPKPITGISSALGGGKTSDEVEKDPNAVAGSIAAFVVVFGA